MCTGRYSSRSAAHANAQAAPLGAGRADGAAARAADVAQVCLGPQTACTPGQPGVTLRNLTVGADGAVFNGPAAFLRPVGFAERAVFQRGMSARLEQLPPFERRVPLNAIPHGTRPWDTPSRPLHGLCSLRALLRLARCSVRRPARRHGLAPGAAVVL
jgi:hypothetical protein